MKILQFICEKYIYIIAFVIVLLAIIEIIDARREKRWWKFRLLVMVIFFTAITPIYELITYTTVEKEEFSMDSKNIKFLKGETGNIFFETKKPILEPVDLRIKDRWIRLVQFTDYDIKDNKKVIINYEFGNNDKINKEVANIGLIFTYKTKKFK